MKSRANYQKLSNASYQALVAFDKTLIDSPLDKTLINLVKIRSSQINGCLFCLDMHSKEAKAHGERELRLYHLPVWRESEIFTDKEKAALAWVELLTHPDQQGIEDEDYEDLTDFFSEKEVADLTLVISSINAWNRLGVAFRPKAGSLDKLLGLDKVGLQ